MRAESAERVEVDRVARLLMAEWERVEGRPVNTSYVATFVDMARVVIADRDRIAGGSSAPLAWPTREVL